nr:unnamed protein product [Spirometra erinaceieuropaei]
MRMASECPLPVNANLTTGAVADFKMIGTVERNPEDKHQHKMFHPSFEVPFGQLSGRENFPQLPMDNPFERTQSESSGNILSGYNFLANQIYRSVSNPLYKLVRTVENTGSEGSQLGNSKQLAASADDSRGFPNCLPSANGAPHYGKFYNTVSVVEASLKPQSSSLSIGACMKFEPSSTTSGSSTSTGNTASDVTSTGPCSNFDDVRCCDEYPEGKVRLSPSQRMPESPSNGAAVLTQSSVVHSLAIATTANSNFCQQGSLTSSGDQGALPCTAISSPSSTSSKSSFSFQGEVQQNPPGRLNTSSVPAQTQQPHRRQNLNIWELPTVHQWYPGAHQRPGQQTPLESSAACHSGDAYSGINWSNSTSSGMQKVLSNPFASISLGLNNNNISTSKQSEVYNTKSETPSPVQSPVGGKAFASADLLSNNAGHLTQRYPQQYFQEWADASNLRDCVYYPSFENATGMTVTGSSIPSPRAEEITFSPPSTAINTGGRGPSTSSSSACLGCCNSATHHPALSTYTQHAVEDSDLQNGLCLMDPMRSLPRYLTSGLWPPCINPKLEWNASNTTDENARLPAEGSRFYTGETDTTSYSGRMSAMQYMNSSYGFPSETKECIGGCFFPPVPRLGHSMYSGRVGDLSVHEISPNMAAAIHHKVETHRFSTMDCDPQELEAFAERFKQRRIKLGVTQADVGKALGRLNLAGVGSFSQSTICRFESLTLSHNNMLALKPILQAWLDEAEQEAAARQKNPNAFEMEDEDKKRKRTSITDPEKRSLEAFFGIQPRPSSEKIAQIAEKLNLKKNVVRVWFCNQRQKQKRMKFSTAGLLHQVNGI